MSIPANELADLMEQATVGAVPREIENTRREANEVRKSGVGAFSDIDGAKFLHSVIDAIKDVLGENALSYLAQVEINSSPSPSINVLPVYTKRIKKILVFEGMKYFISFHTDLIKVLDQLQFHRPNIQYRFPNGSIVNESLAFSMAGYSILSYFQKPKSEFSDYDFQKLKRVQESIHDMLGTKARNEVIVAVYGALVFVLLHEIGHIELGHIGKTGVYSERQHFSLLEQEALSLSKENELAADNFAIRLLPKKSRVDFMPSLVFLLGAFAFLEVFSGNLDEKHPLAVNRLSSIVEECEAPPEYKDIVINWIEQQRKNLKFYESDRTDNGGSIWDNIDKTMPVDLAVKIIGDIKYRVFIECGLLDRN